MQVLYHTCRDRSGDDSTPLPSQAFPMFSPQDWAFPGFSVRSLSPSAVTRIEWVSYQGETWGCPVFIRGHLLFSFVNLNHSHSLLEIHQRWFRSHHCSSVQGLWEAPLLEAPSQRPPQTAPPFRGPSERPPSEGPLSLSTLSLFNYSIPKRESIVKSFFSFISGASKYL
jgi:hypothetical protein